MDGVDFTENSNIFRVKHKHSKFTNLYVACVGIFLSIVIVNFTENPSFQFPFAIYFLLFFFQLPQGHLYFIRTDRLLHQRVAVPLQQMIRKIRL